MRNLTEKEINEAYEKNTGVLIADEFDRPGRIILQHLPFSARITDRSHGARMPMRLYTMPLFWKKLPRWQPAVS